MTRRPLPEALEPAREFLQLVAEMVARDVLRQLQEQPKDQDEEASA